MNDQLKIEYIPIGDIKPYKNNAKLHPKEQIEQIKKSIREFGFDDPIAVWKDNIIIEGHGRLLAAQELGLEEIPIIRLDGLTDEQRRAYTLVHNQLTMNSGFDIDMLNVELGEIEAFDMSDFGFDINLDDERPKETVEDDYDEELPEEPKAKLGDIYQLGKHRLICGDSTDADTISRLMEGNKAKILFTSPPYSDMREYNGEKDLSVSNIAKFIGAYKPYTDYQCVNLGIQRKDHEIVQYWDEYIRQAKEAGYKLMAWNVWDKTMAGSIGQQAAFFPIRHEWIFVFGTEFFEINETWEKKESSINQKRTKRKVRKTDGTTRYSSIGDTSNKYKQMESVVSICSETGKIRALHPATFPVALPSEYIKSMTDEGDIVIEPFGGSGTTMIACEQLNRKCYMCELDPHYVDVIISRWEQYTGEKAKKIND